MKKRNIFLFVQFFISTLLFAQLPKDSWSLNFGASYPRLVNHSYTYAGNVNFGGFLGVQRNFSEHVGLRMQIAFDRLEGIYGNPALSSFVNSFSGNFD
ncbi:MAG: hypothetical protein AB1298_10645, partial [Bacteroidota bacterium]